MTAPRATIVSGCPGDTRRYRVDHAAEALVGAGWRVRRMATEAAWRPEDLPDGDLLILHRVAWTERVAEFMDIARGRGVPVVFDTDDLVFEEVASERLAQLAGGADYSGDSVDNGVSVAGAALAFAPPAAFMQTLQASDGAFVASAPLARAVEDAGRPAAVVRNALSLEILRLSSRAWRVRESLAAARTHIVIGYASGTATHDRDFECCARPLRDLMAADERIILRIIGPLALAPEWRPVASRIERLDYMPWRQLPQAIADFDINLAPLDLDDPFSRAKSELKWFEAGAVGIPTIASPAAAFATAIDDGRTGLLAADEAAWTAALQSLVQDQAARLAMGRGARAAVIDGYVTDLRGLEIEAAFAGLAAIPRHAQVIRPSIAVEDRGSEAAIAIAVEDAGSEPALSAALSAGLNRLGASSSRPPRLAIALGTSALEAAEATGAPTLLMLDSPPALPRLPMGDEYVLATRAARSGTPVLALGPWLASWLASDGANVVAVAPLPLETLTFTPGIPQSERERSVALDLSAFEDPSTQDLGIAALAAAQAADPSASIEVFGSRAVAGHVLSAMHIALPESTWLGMLDADSRAALLKRVALLVMPMALGPTTAIVEAAACGCVVVAGVPWPMEGTLGEDIIVPAPCQSDALGARVAALLRDAPARELLSERAYDRVERLSNGRTADAVAAAVQSCAGVDGPIAIRATPPLQLDHLQALEDGSGHPLGDGEVVQQSFRCRFDGLCRIDIRLAAGDGPPSGAIELRLSAGPGPGRIAGQPGPRAVASGPEALRVARYSLNQVPPDLTAAFEFAPLHSSAGHLFEARWSWRDGNGKPPSLLGAGIDAFAGGRTTAHGEVLDGWTPAFSTWCRPLPRALPPPFATSSNSQAIELLHELSWRTAEEARALAILEAALPNRLRLLALRQGHPLPPLNERPWPPDAPAARKLWGVLRHYGPIALVRELVSLLRWIRLSETERATATHRSVNRQRR